MWECFKIKIAIIPDAILSLYPTLIQVKSLKRLSFNQKTWIQGSLMACFPIVEAPLSKILNPYQLPVLEPEL